MDETLPTSYTDAMHDRAEQYRDVTDLLAHITTKERTPEALLTALTAAIAKLN